MNSLGSLAGGFKSRAGAPAWFTCLNAPMHESQGRFPAEELERKAAAPTSDTLHSASQNTGWEELLAEAAQRKGGRLTWRMLLRRLLQIPSPVLHLFSALPG